jgi:hypothetical protein
MSRFQNENRQPTASARSQPGLLAHVIDIAEHYFWRCADNPAHEDLSTAETGDKVRLPLFGRLQFHRLLI